jgi:hypothetical protein
VPAGDASAASSIPLVGTFVIAPGTCNATALTITGSYFRLIFPGGNVTRGPFLNNAASLCSTISYTPLSPGTQRGLVTKAFQPNPAPAFTHHGDALANDITRPVSFIGVNLALSTNSPDPQTRRSVPPPSISVEGGHLSGQVEALSVAWNKLFMNQGSPKPGGGPSDLSVPLSGSYNSRSHAFVMTWTSKILKGPFNQFTGYWRLSGRFYPSGSTIPSNPFAKTGSTTRPRTTSTTSTTAIAARTTSTTQPHVTTTSAKSTTTTTPPNPGLRQDVHLINCGATAGGWYAGGTINNPGSSPVTYNVTVSFTSSSGSDLASASTSQTVAGGGYGFWRAASSLAVPGQLGCVLRTVTAG